MKYPVLLLAAVMAWLPCCLLRADAPPPDPNRAYQAALPLYQYAKAQPFAIKAVETKTFSDCRMQRFSYGSADKQRVPALLFVPKSASRAHPVPCLVLLHGFNMNKEMMAGLARFAVTRGYAALAIDEYGQGERAPAKTHGTMSAQALQDELIAGLPQTVIDVRRGLDYLSTRPEIDHHRFGLIGFSLGAIIGSVAAGVDTRLKATVLVSGGGDWATILRYLAANIRTVDGKPLTGAQDINWPLLSALLTPDDPVTFAPHIAPRALLMVNGRRDTTVIPQAAEELYAAAHNVPGARAQIVWLPNTGHVPPPELVYPVVQRWLSTNF